MFHLALLKPRRAGWQAFPLALALLSTACATPRRPVAATLAPPPSVVAPAPRFAASLPVAEQNRVALLVPLTGANAPVGQSIANAANMALLDVGNSRVNLRVYDTTPGAAGAAARALADGARLVLGPLLAGDVRAVAAVAAPAGVPVLSFSNDAGLAGGDIYVLGFQPGQSIARSIAYARSRGIERFAALVPAGTYGQRAQLAFVRAVQAAGGRSTAIAAYTRAPARMLAAARTVTAYDARAKASSRPPAIRPDGSVAPTTSAPLAPVPFQALLIADAGGVAGQFAPVLARLGAVPGRTILIGTELWNNEPGIANAASLRGALFAAVPDDRFRTLAGRYRTKYGSAPSRLASFGYDSILLVNSIAGNWPLGAPFPRGLLMARAGFAGIDGAFRFTPSNIAERSLEVQQIGYGTITTVSPAARGF